MFLAKFASRFQILQDESASIKFSAMGSQVNPIYNLSLNSTHMSSSVTNKPFEGKLANPADIKDEYVTTLKKEVLLRFFKILKLSGNALMHISNS